MEIIKQKLMKKVNIRKIFDIGLFFYLILNQLHYIFSFKGLVQIALVSTINAIGIAMLIIVMFKKMDKRVLITTALLILFGSLSYVTIGNFNISVYVTVLRYLGVVMYLLYYRQNPKMMTIIMYTTLVLFMPVLFSRLGYNMFSKSSRNYYSIILLMANFVYNKSFWDIKRKAPIFPTIASMFISIFAGGRGGILAYGIFFFGTLIENFKHIKENPKSKIVDDISDTQEIPIITDKMIKKAQKGSPVSFVDQYKRELITIVSILLIFSTIFSLKYLNKKYKFFNFRFQDILEVLEDNVTDDSYGFEGKALKSGTRITMIEKYLHHMFSNVKYFFNGVDLNLEDVFVKYGFNLHNSFLALHSKFGIGGLILCGYLGFRALYIMIRKKEWAHSLIYLAVLLRVFIDTAAFPGHLDIIIFYYFFRFYYMDADRIYAKNINNDNNIKIFKKFKKNKKEEQKV